jgi:hypothetical protein
MKIERTSDGKIRISDGDNSILIDRKGASSLYITLAFLLEEMRREGVLREDEKPTDNGNDVGFAVQNL